MDEIRNTPPCDSTREPDDYLQGEAITLVSLLEHFDQRGFTGQFAERDGEVMCFACRNLTSARLIPVVELRRLEGASDPDDMLAVIALACPRCDVKGTLTLNYGPEATEGQSELLVGMQSGHSGDPPTDRVVTASTLDDYPALQ